jgi:type I restriction enzyme S subunit
MNWADQIYSLGRGVCSIRGRSQLDTKFIKYCLDYELEALLKRAGGGTFPNLTRNDIATFPIPYPSHRYQIAAILSAYDDLIENNIRRIAILEDMAQAVYREWFVHFRFPGHKRVELTESSRGEIPESWTISTLINVCTSVNDGDWIETKDQGGNDYRLLQVSNIGVGEFIETNKFRYITQDTFERLRCQEVKPGDILVSRMPKPTGRAWLVTEMPWRMVTAVDIAILNADLDKADPLFLTYLMNSPEHLSLVEKHATGTTRPRVSRRNLTVLPIIVPPIELQQKFRDFTEVTYNLSNSLRLRNTILRQTRDLLLPRLVSGELDVSGLEIEVGD